MATLPGIPYSSQIVLNIAKPLDAKMRLSTANRLALDDITQAWIGMIVYDTDLDVWKQLTALPSSSPANWSDFWAWSWTFLRLDGTNSPTANIDFGGFGITNLLDPINPQEAATKNYVDTEISTISWNFVLKTWDTMLGDLDFQNTYSVNNVKEMISFGDLSTLNFTSWIDTRPINPANHYNQVWFRQDFLNGVRGFLFEPDNWFNIRLGNFTGTPPYNSWFNILWSNEERLFSVSDGTVQFDNWSSFSNNHYMSDGTNGWTFGGLWWYEGLTYDNDYSATYVARSLVDKEYVDNAISWYTYTSNNWITLTGNNFQFGGALIQNTSITWAFNLSLDIGEFSKTVNRDILRWTGVDSPSWDQMNQVNTTNATPTATTLFTTATDKSYTVELNVTATRTGGSAGTAGDAASYKRTFRVKNLGGTVTLGSVVDVYTDEDQTGWNLTAIVSGLNVQAQVTGATNNNIKWSIETNVVEGTFTP